MAKRTVGFLVGLVLAAGAALLLSSCQATGTITGTVTDASTHAPLPGITVELHGGDGAIVSTLTTDGTGRWTSPELAPGDLTLRFSDPSGTHATRWFDSEPTAASATKVTVAGGAIVHADQSLQAPGAISGTVTDAHGPTGAMYAVVLVPHTLDLVAAAATGPDGTYTVSDLDPGTYNVAFLDPTWDPRPPRRAPAPPLRRGRARPGTGHPGGRDRRSDDAGHQRSPHRRRL